MREDSTVSLLARLAELEALPLAETRKVWTDMFGQSPPAVGKELLTLGIGYEIQARVHGSSPLGSQRVFTNELSRVFPRPALECPGEAGLV
jgi:DUF2924 family protein